MVLSAPLESRLVAALPEAKTVTTPYLLARSVMARRTEAWVVELAAFQEQLIARRSTPAWTTLVR